MLLQIVQIDRRMIVRRLDNLDLLVATIGKSGLHLCVDRLVVVQPGKILDVDKNERTDTPRQPVLHGAFNIRHNVTLLYHRSE